MLSAKTFADNIGDKLAPYIVINACFLGKHRDGQRHVIGLTARRWCRGIGVLDALRRRVHAPRARLQAPHLHRGRDRELGFGLGLGLGVRLRLGVGRGGGSGVGLGRHASRCKREYIALNKWNQNINFLLY
jgi:hypothetical protein